MCKQRTDSESFPFNVVNLDWIVPIIARCKHSQSINANIVLFKCSSHVCLGNICNVKDGLYMLPRQNHSYRKNGLESDSQRIKSWSPTNKQTRTQIINFSLDELTKLYFHCFRQSGGVRYLKSSQSEFYWELFIINIFILLLLYS